MKTKTLLIGGLVAVGAAGILWYVLRKRAETSTIVTGGGTTQPSGDSTAGILGGIASLVGAAAGAFGTVGDAVNRWADTDDQKVDPNAGYVPTVPNVQLDYSV